MLKKTILGGIIFGVMSFGASAELVKLDNGNIQDTTTGLEWRYFSGTVNKSLGDIENMMESGELSSYRIAYYDEVTRLFDGILESEVAWNGGASSFSFGVTRDEINNYYNLFGVTSTAWEASYGIGYIDETKSSVFSMGADRNSNGDMFYQTNPQSLNFKSTNRGVFLIDLVSLDNMNNLLDVPVTMFGAGFLLPMVSLFGRKKRNKK